MNTLYTYIKAIKNQQSGVSITHQHAKAHSYMDDGVEVSESVTTYHYDNGVVIRCRVERDNYPTELACEECWISYEVIESAQQSIRPSRKVFHNACQESFWLKMQESLATEADGESPLVPG